jgi:predicted signal transduction protein with EAL and GGDEF domain
VARRLSEALRPGDTIARLGGDEFAVLVEGLGGESDAVVVATRLLDALAVPFELEGREAFVAASVGIALGWPGATSATDLLREADVALSRAKGDPTTSHSVFVPGMSEASLERLDLDGDLRRAVGRGELRLYYQPLVDLRCDRVIGHEALVRWQHPSRGLLAPAAFIPLAEETGLIVELGEWVLREACRQTREWQRELPAPDLLVSVNLSARQFARPDLADMVGGILAETGLAAGRLELEITESVVMSEAETTIATLRQLHGMGVRLVLDDFGTGYSSLSYLPHLPLDIIKVDRAFVAGISEDPANLSIIRAVAALAHGLGLEVTAEGIERPEQLDAVRDLGCERGQGYLFARPLPAAEAGLALVERSAAA